jgi:DNA-binding response OmpR family regulator
MILLVEDDVAIGRSVTQGLGAKGFAMRWLRQGGQVMEVVARGQVDVVILDLGLPDGDGLDLCRALRGGGYAMPILMLTARTTLDDRLEGFAAGADDYLSKPFAFAELVARVGVLARRAAQLVPAPVTYGALAVDRSTGQVSRHGEALSLEPKALALVGRLIEGHGQVVARQSLIDAVWGMDAVVADNTLDVAISALRRRLAEAAPDLTLRSIKGRGFQLESADLIP